MHKLFGRFLEGRAGLALLLLRVVFGAGLMMHGWRKIQAPFEWMGDDGPPGFVQALAALGEFGGGLGILLGFLTPLSAFGALCVMIGAWYLRHQGDPWIASGTRTFELASLYGTVALAFIIAGPGRYSLDGLIFGRNKR